MKRTIYTVEPIKHPIYGWVARVSGGTTPGIVRWCLTKQDAVADGRELARAFHRIGGLTQLRIKGRDGRVQTEHNYSDDPRRFNG